ncbi:hypothetical protein DSO57_1035825 [Entomophthora muscae]|uniref:Uncharacterized protein n=1 Tax=Entomophthora muscae TaxID=34485 RepID=A0ACC2TLC5_9FUNG|nr:hypothetical protein DSO57_1035825 [Entomophthora muscae]
MASAIPLQDEDRWPWLRDIKTNIILKFSAQKVTQPKQDLLTPVVEKCNFVVLSCSSLKKCYRQVLLNELKLEEPFDDVENAYHTLILYLKGSYDLILERLKARKNHFAGPGLLQSQFKTLEEPLPEEENVVAIPISEPPSVIYDLSYAAAVDYATSLLNKSQYKDID